MMRTPSKSSSQDIDRMANELLRTLTAAYDSKYGFGTMSFSIYDTAWVSMLSREPHTSQDWLFPECFQFILGSQLEDGGWAGYSGTIDGLLNTIASLLAMKKHQKAFEKDGIQNASVALEARIRRAKAYLDVKLDEWDIDSTLHVGFEVIVPTLLELLEQEGMVFQFRGRDRLAALNQQKMAKFQPRMLETGPKTALLHSLEALIGKIDFNHLRHHTTLGSMLGSPSSTAAYLMNIDGWDDEAEDYLRHVVSRASSMGWSEQAGGVPSAFPSTFFEYSWVITNLLEHGFESARLPNDALSFIKDVLEDGFRQGNGLLGFAPGILPDADDTAKGLIALGFLGAPCTPGSLVQEYESEGHFRTYGHERNSSFSANCNVLSSLLHAQESSEYVRQIEKAARFICNAWWNEAGHIQDKWNLSPHYSILVMSQSLTRMFAVWQEGRLPGLADDLLRLYAPVALMQALVRTLHTQNDDGSWGSTGLKCEETAYAVLSLANILSLPFTAPLTAEVQAAIDRGRHYIGTKDLRDLPGDYLWIEKVTYRSATLSRSYVLAAMKTAVPLYDLSCSKTRALFDGHVEKLKPFGSFWSRLPLYSEVPRWKITASLIEGYLFLPELKRLRLDVFSREGLVPDHYLEYIPFTWTGANNRDGALLSARLLRDMMVISLLNYQADEFMEAVVEKRYSDSLPDVRRLITRLLDDFEEFPNGSGYEANRNGLKHEKNGNGYSSEHRSYADVEEPLRKFISAVMDHPGVQGSGKQQLMRELEVFLLAHVQQIEDNKNFARQAHGAEPGTTATFHSPPSSFFGWVRGVSAKHTSCHYAFAFLFCIINRDMASFESAQETYLAEGVCTHLATLCRMYNDYGSLARDKAQMNLNSLNFPEFAADPGANEGSMKQALMEITGYERKCLNLALEELSALLIKHGKAGLAQVVRVFCNVTDTYGQVYVIRDIGVQT